MPGLCLLLLLAGGCAWPEPAADDFQVTLFDGEPFKLSDHAGQNAVVVNFWYPSCAPCREEMPHFQAAWQQFQGPGDSHLPLPPSGGGVEAPESGAGVPPYLLAAPDYGPKDVRFLGLFVPTGLDSEQDARDFVADWGLTFDFAVDSRGAVDQSYDVEFYPTTYFINRQGQVFRVHVGNLDLDTINKTLADMGIEPRRGRPR